jgi:hypothetical protein
MGGDTRVVILLISGNRAGTCEPRMEYLSEASVVSDVTWRHRGRAYLQPPQHGLMLLLHPLARAILLTEKPVQNF